MGIRRGLACALALAPWFCALHLPRLLVGQSLEQSVDAALPVAVSAIAALSVLINMSLADVPSSPWPHRFARGLIGLLVGTVFFHILIVLFGAPFEVLVQRTALLALLLAAMTTVPLAMHVGLAWKDWTDIVLNVRARDDVEVHIASVAIAATLGAYLGAIPIPLDWDRPWQQWPLTCVYGTLGGSTLGHVVGMALAEWIKKHKTE